MVFYFDADNPFTQRFAIINGLTAKMVRVCTQSEGLNGCYTGILRIRHARTCVDDCILLEDCIVSVKILE